MNVGIYIYDNAEVLDFSGPFEVFSTASRFLDTHEKFNTFLISEKNKVVVGRGGYQVNSHYTITNHPLLDVLIVVGGIHTQEMRKSEVVDWIKEQSEKVNMTASVCTGVFLLAASGVVTNHQVTTHWEDLKDLKISYPLLNVVSGVRWIEDQDVVSSAGISAGIDMSLHLVSKIKGIELAQKTAKQMQFDWTKN